MTTLPAASGASTGTGPWPPRRVICAVDGSRGSGEAVRQALAICPPDVPLTFVAVTWAVGYGPMAMASVSPTRARRALEDAQRAAAEAGRRAEVSLVESGDAPELVLDMVEPADLLVLGTSGHSRLQGISLGRFATVAAHRAPCDVLIARPPKVPGSFPRAVLLAFDGTPASQRAGDLALALAAGSGARLTMVNGGPPQPAERKAVAAFSAAVVETLGSESVIETPRGDIAEAICDLAGTLGVPLVVVGSRRLHGLRALRSVSERVAHAAPCSVLIARGR